MLGVSEDSVLNWEKDRNKPTGKESGEGKDFPEGFKIVEKFQIYHHKKTFFQKSFSPLFEKIIQFCVFFMV